MKKYLILALGSLGLAGCATHVPLASQVADQQAKQFIAPTDKAGLYIYRKSILMLGNPTKKALKIDGKVIGISAPDVYFYKKVPAGEHIVATESEFGENKIKLNMQAGKLYCIHQYMRFDPIWGGLFSQNANIETVPLDKCKEVIKSLKLAQSYQSYD